MAGLCVMAVILTFLMSAEKGLAVDPGRLATFVSRIKTTYGMRGMFSLAVSIPDNLDLNQNEILRRIFVRDPANNVKNEINNGGVYNQNRVVAAKKAEGNPDHAELRVVRHLMDLLRRNNKNDLLLFYVYASPCRQTCIEHRSYNILTEIKKMKEWNNYAFVFTKPFYDHAGDMTDNDRRHVLTELGKVIGLDNIFRCNEENRWMQCTNCKDGENVASYCISE